MGHSINALLVPSAKIPATNVFSPMGHIDVSLIVTVISTPAGHHTGTSQAVVMRQPVEATGYRLMFLQFIHPIRQFFY
jgi:hypothetical protein